MSTASPRPCRRWAVVLITTSPRVSERRSAAAALARADLDRLGGDRRAQQHAPSPSAMTWFDICSASPVLTYHSHLAPSGSVTQVSVLVA